MDSDDIRLVTEDEVAHFREHGWVKLDRLLSPDVAERLRERSIPWIAFDSTDHSLGWWIDYYDPIDKDDEFRALGYSETMGLNAQRLMRRRTGVLIYSNLLAVKVGGEGSSPSGPSPWHQDGTDTPIDRSSWVRFWIALDHITPTMGAINFIDRSHQLGPLGNRHLEALDPDRKLLDLFPDLAASPQAGPLEFQPGDATVHSMFTVHGALGNDTTDPRRAFILTYFSDDTRYTASSDAPALLKKAEDAGLRRGDLFAGPTYPRVRGPEQLV